MAALTMVEGIAAAATSTTTSTPTQQLPQWNAADWGPQPHNPTDFTTFLWYGFSANKKNFTRQDFKHLVDCTTNHHHSRRRRHHCPPLLQEPPVAALTSCDANTALTPTQCHMLKACSEDDLLTAYGLEGGGGAGGGGSLSVYDLRSLLPAMTYLGQRGDAACTTPEGSVATSAADADPGAIAANTKPRPSEVWGYGILFVTLISGCSLAGVSVLPLMAHTFYQQLLTLLVGLAVGSLAASSLFHLIPQAFRLAEKDEGHGYLLVSLFVLLGVWGFFMVERIIKIIVTHTARKEKNNFPGRQSDQDILYNNIQSPVSPHPPISLSDGYGQGTLGGRKEVSLNGGVGVGVEPSTPQDTCGPGDVGLIYASQQQAIRASFGHNERPNLSSTHAHSLEFRQGQDSVIRTVAWMIIFGDGFHNFIDGVSIGAAFSESILTGISISLAVMCEELPHELGDFAVLLNAGMTMRQAVSYNFLSATTCYLGLFLGILLGEFTQDNTAVFAVAAGMFLYIALVDMVPEMNEVASKAAEGGWRSALVILLFQNIGIFIGITSLFCLAYFQDSMVLA